MRNKKTSKRSKYTVSPLGKLKEIPFAHSHVEMSKGGGRVRVDIRDDLRKHKEQRGRYSLSQCWVDGVFFRSGTEAKRYSKLCFLEKARVIQDLTTQPAFKIEHNGVKIKRIAFDFGYYLPEEGLHVVEDVKGKIEPIFELNWKLMSAFYPDVFKCII